MEIAFSAGEEDGCSNLSQSISSPSKEKNMGSDLMAAIEPSLLDNADAQFQEFIKNGSPVMDPFSAFSPITGRDEDPILSPEVAPPAQGLNPWPKDRINERERGPSILDEPQAHHPATAAPEASAARREVSVSRKISLETSLRNRIRALENKGSRFIEWNDGKGDFFYGDAVKRNLASESNQHLYN